MMHRTSHLFLLIGALAILPGCHRDNDNASPSGGGGGAGGGGTPSTDVAMVQFTIDGDGFSNEAITINPATGSGQAAYSTADDQTTGTCASADGKLFDILFNGNTTGTQSYDGNTSTHVGYSFSINGAIYMAHEGTVVIEEYGAVGGWVRGSFNGTALRMNGATAGDQVTISNSSFRLKRMPDL